MIGEGAHPGSPISKLYNPVFNSRGRFKGDGEYLKDKSQDAEEEMKVREGCAVRR